MHEVRLVLAAAVAAAAILMILICIFFTCKYTRSCGKPINQTRLYAGVVGRLGSKEPFDSALRNGNRVASAWRTTYPIKPFNWSEHPSLITEAVEHGWATFAFAYTCSTCPVPSTIWDMCTGCSHVKENEPELSWEMGPGSDYMQKIRLNPGLPMRKNNGTANVQALQTALPLPGPPLGPLSFPQEAYYEITVLTEGQEYNADLSQHSLIESEPSKLMSRHFLSGKKLSSDTGNNFPTEVFEEKIEIVAAIVDGLEGDMKTMQNGNEKVIRPAFSTIDQLQMLAIGFGAGGAPPFRLPGCDGGSVGFHSGGQIYVNGAPYAEQDLKLQSAKRAWSVVNSTVGCGFDPSKKKVFFTLNGKLVSELICPSSDFRSPLYPTLAANYDVTVLANFGQSSFEYAPANFCRVADPCFKRPVLKSGKNGVVYEDSGDLFSIVASNSQDLQHCHQHVLSETESDLFEIVLEGRG